MSPSRKAPDPDKNAKLFAYNARNADRLRQDAVAGQFAFVLTELDTAITFCDVALSTDNREKKERNIQNGCKGYETALRFSEALGADFKNDERFQEKLSRLKSRLEQLGERI